MANHFRLRVQLPDRPGALAAMAAVLGEAGANIVRLDVHDLDGAGAGDAVDDVIVSLDDGDPEDLGTRLGAAGAGRLTAWRPESATTDSVVRVLQWARAVVRDGIGYDDLELSRALLGVCSADVAWVATRDHAATSELGRAVLDAPLAPASAVAALPAELGGAAGAAWLVGLVDDLDHPRLVAAVARRRADPFTTTELDRARALLALHHELVPSGGTAAGA